MKKKLKWKVAPAPTGPYHSFFKRDWPSARYNNEQESPAVSLDCEDDYSPKRAELGQHGPIKVRIADHSVSPWKWRAMVKRASTLKEAKEQAEDFLERHPEFSPVVDKKIAPEDTST